MACKAIDIVLYLSTIQQRQISGLGSYITALWKLAGSPAGGASDFTDVSPNAAYAPAVAWAVEHDVTSGMGDGTFSPDSTCTRAQIVTFLYRALA